jgi:hypothetical protein
MARIEIHSGQSWTLHLPGLESSIIDALPDRLEQLLGNPDENRRVIERLFPVSYSDAEQEREHRRLLGSALLSERRDMLKRVRISLRAARRRAREAGATGVAPGAGAGAGAGADLGVRLDADTLDLWLRFVNDLRLMLATELGVEENLGSKVIEPTDPDGPRYTLLVYLGGLESLLVEAAIGDPGY